MTKKLKINSVNPSGPNSDGTELEGYYFEQSGNGYNLYAPPVKVNTQLITSQNPNVSVTVPGNPHPFLVTVTSFPVEILSGTWNDTGSVTGTPGSGTFQAQAGGTGPIAEEAAAATAK